ncbi:hypothetical protein F5148DRAFT_1365234 [Russula earlei]|uniref:Uncharacterized protein n=1 Tax=Russula earlei TaxID=71964 RepID=A0ACC0ULS8_9AGAM|nr:hypothetical protein F5148DRAFT_1365234 [Russula earlei]
MDNVQQTETIHEYEHLWYIPIVLLALFHQNLPCLNLKWCLDNSISSKVTTPMSTQDLASVLISAPQKKRSKN